MATIDQQIAELKLAEKGSEVRTTLTDALTEMNDEIESTTSDMLDIVESTEPTISSLSESVAEAEEAIEESVSSFESWVANAKQLMEGKDASDVLADLLIQANLINTDFSSFNRSSKEAVTNNDIADIFGHEIEISGGDSGDDEVVTEDPTY